MGLENNQPKKLLQRVSANPVNNKYYQATRQMKANATLKETAGRFRSNGLTL
jgi:hypothetical protein